ncbi:hypothetical protein BC828DRAFT_385203 [Blastocladiella britannica]|nr:hypothetical protein BC828DRAFT_385203 [Blastocladiella britannica]
MADAPCTLDPSGLAPADFINADIVPGSAISALAASSPTVYGCVQFLNVGTSSAGRWFCATDSPSQERKSTGRNAACAPITQESACTAPWLWQQPAGTGQAVGGAPLSAYMQGCFKASSSKFTCTAAGIACTPLEVTSGGTTKVPDGASPSGDDDESTSSSGIIIGALAAAGALLVGGFGFFLYRRSRAGKGSRSPMAAQRNISPGTGSTGAAASGNSSGVALALSPVTNKQQLHGATAAAASVPRDMSNGSLAPGSSSSSTLAMSTSLEPAKSGPAAATLTAAGAPVAQIPVLMGGGNGGVAAPSPLHASHSLPAPAPAAAPGSSSPAMAAHAHERARLMSASGIHAPGSPDSYASSDRSHRPVIAHADMVTLPRGIVYVEQQQPAMAMQPMRPQSQYGQQGQPMHYGGHPQQPYYHPQQQQQYQQQPMYAQGHAPSMAAPNPAGDAFPRPYASYANLGAAPPTAAAATAASVAPVATAMPAPSERPSTHSQLTAPDPTVATFLALDWNLPLSAPLRTPQAAELCASKAHLPGYGIQDLVDEWEAFQVRVRDMVRDAYEQVAATGTAGPHSRVFMAVTGMSVDSDAESAADANMAAFTARVVQLLTSDVFGALASPIAIESYLVLLSGVMPELKKDLRVPPPETPGTSSPNARLSTHMLAVALDHVRSTPALAPLLAAHLYPTMAQAGQALTSLFTAHALPAPEPHDIETLVAEMATWALRLKREYPAVGLYVPLPHSRIDPMLEVVEGAPTANGVDVDDQVVAFVTCPGIWDASIGNVGFYARVWAVAE